MCRMFYNMHLFFVFTGLDEGFLSVVFACILLVIAGVTVYAFVVLYTAVHKRWTEQPED